MEVAGRSGKPIVVDLSAATFLTAFSLKALMAPLRRGHQQGLLYRSGTVLTAPRGFPGSWGGFDFRHPIHDKAPRSATSGVVDLTTNCRHARPAEFARSPDWRYISM